MMTNKAILKTNDLSRSLLTALFLAVLAVLPAQAIQLFGKSDKQLNVRTTAYTHTEADHLKHGQKTASGTLLQAGKVNSAAADWGFLPYGTTFRIKGDPGKLYQVDDYGRALTGTKTVDIYFPTTAGMNQWGVRHVEIEIVKFGCVDTSIEFLEGRTKYAHCRDMLDRLRDMQDAKG